jgi:hypothetical protein
LLDERRQGQLRSGVAKLLFIGTHVRPDISLPVNYLCSRAEKYTQDDYVKFIHILEYLNNDPERGLIMKAENEITINVYADASFGSHIEDSYKSHSGLIIQIGDSTIYWKSSKQRIVTKSSTEAELVCASDALSIMYYIRDWLLEKNIAVKEINLFQDNKSTIYLIENDQSNSLRSRHINIKYFFIRERVKDGDFFK